MGAIVGGIILFVLGAISRFALSSTCPASMPPRSGPS